MGLGKELHVAGSPSKFVEVISLICLIQRKVCSFRYVFFLEHSALPIFTVLKAWCLNFEINK